MAEKDSYGEYEYEPHYSEAIPEAVWCTICRYDGLDEHLTVPEEIDGYPVGAIGDGAFCYNKFLKSITLPKTVTEIGDAAFEGCTNLESISLPAHLQVEKLDAPEGCRVIRRE